MKGRTIGIGYGVIGLWTLWPVFSVIISMTVARANGCILHEGGVNPCVVLGRDIGGILYTMFTSGWFGLITLPTGFAAAVVFTIIVVILSVKKRNAA